MIPGRPAGGAAAPGNAAAPPEGCTGAPGWVGVQLRDAGGRVLARRFLRDRPAAVAGAGPVTGIALDAWGVLLGPAAADDGFPTTVRYPNGDHTVTWVRTYGGALPWVRRAVLLTADGPVREAEFLPVLCPAGCTLRIRWQQVHHH